MPSAVLFSRVMAAISIVTCGLKDYWTKVQYTGSPLVDRRLIIFSATLIPVMCARLMLVSRVRFIQHFFLVALDIQKLSVEYIGTSRHQVGHAMD